MYLHAAPVSVLLADGQRIVLEGLRQLVDSWRPMINVVATASSIDAVYAALENHRPDVLVTDIELGGRSVLEIMPSLLSDSDCKPLLLIGRPSLSDINAGILAGVRGVVGKEESPESLRLAIEKVYQGELWIDRDSAARVLHVILDRGDNKEGWNDKLHLLTAAERKIVAAVVREFGAPNKVIARQLCISESTLRNHLTSIYCKLKVGNRSTLYMHVTGHAQGTQRRH